MDISQLREFKTIVECGSINKASAQLFVSQSTLSRSVQKLEQEFGIQLLNREKNSVVPTEAGTLILYQIDVILKQYDKLMNTSSVFSKKPDNYITIAASSIAALRYFSTEFNRLSPSGCIAFGTTATYDNILNLINDDEYDIFIVNNPIKENGIENYKWGTIQYYVNVSKDSPLYNKKSLNILDLNGQTIISLMEHSYLLDLIKDLGLNISFVMEPEYSVFHSLLKGNTSLICLVSDFATKDYLDLNRRNIPIEGQAFVNTVYISYKKENEERLKPYLEWVKTCSYTSSVSWNPNPNHSL